MKPSKTLPGVSSKGDGSHSKEFSPRLCEVIGDEQLLVAIRSAIKRAEGYGFTYRGPARLFVEMMFLCGSGFDTDPQYPAVGEVLRAEGDQMQRAEQIHQGFLDYLERVSGPGAANVHKALTDLLNFSQTPLSFPDGFTAGMLREIKRIFPQKVAYVGEAGLKALIGEGGAKAAKIWIHDTARGRADCGAKVWIRTRLHQRPAISVDLADARRRKDRESGCAGGSAGEESRHVAGARGGEE